MTITDIRLQQYRSYTDSSYELGTGVTIVVGPNAVGKTNLLEAIMMVCVGKSYRAKDVDLICRGTEWARIDIHTDTNTTRTLKLQIDRFGRIQKTFEIDEKLYKKLPIQHQQPLVLFEPNNLQLIADEPSSRRSYLDDLLEQYVPEYDKFVNHYRRVLMQRNALLKKGPKVREQLFAWNLRLADLGEHIVAQRAGLIENINKELSDIYTLISKQDKSVQVVYQSKIPVSNYSTHLLKKLEADIDIDFARGFTGNGPHRDDFTIYFSDQPALLSASRGEIRTIILGLKVIELKILQAERGIKPILLLDDVFSELDGSRRKTITQFLSNYQTIITTTDADVIIKNFSKQSTIIPISSGY